MARIFDLHGSQAGLRRQDDAHDHEVVGRPWLPCQRHPCRLWR